MQGNKPFDHVGLRIVYRNANGKGAWIVNNGLTAALANQALADGADLVAFSRPFIANPGLTFRLREEAALNVPDRSTFYGGGTRGYTDLQSIVKA